MKYTFLVGIVLALTLSVLAFQQVEALAILKFKVPKAPVEANQTLTIKGTSMASNATATNCNVQFQTNQAGYQVVTPLGTGPDKFVNWTVTSPPLIQGVNSFEAQLMCFPPGHIDGAPSLVKHLVHNVTAISGPAPTPQALPQQPQNAPAVQQ